MKKTILLLIISVMVVTHASANDISQLTQNIKDGLRQYGKETFMMSVAENLNTYTPVTVGPDETVVKVSYDQGILLYKVEITGRAKELSFSGTEQQKAYANKKIQNDETDNGCGEPTIRAYLNNGITISRIYVSDDNRFLLEFSYDLADCLDNKSTEVATQEGKGALSEADKQKTIILLQTISSQPTDTLRKKMWEDEFGKIESDDIDDFFLKLAKNVASMAPMQMNQYQWLTSAVYMPPAKLLRYSYIIEGIQDTLSPQEFRERLHLINQNNYCTNSKLWWARVGGVDVTHSYKDSNGKSILVDRIIHGNCK
jgi:hypothetical protein